MRDRASFIVVFIVALAGFGACVSRQGSTDGGGGGTGATAGTGSGTAGTGGTSDSAGTSGGGTGGAPAGTGGIGADASCAGGSSGSPGTGGQTVVSDCDGGCPDGGTCFPITAEHRVCATIMPPQPVPDGGAGLPADECGTPGATCPSGQECRRQRISAGAAAGGPTYRNRCGHDACARNEDCPTGQACQPPVDVPFSTTTFNAFYTCVPAQCRGDADCTCGRLCDVYGVYTEQNSARYTGPVCR